MDTAKREKIMSLYEAIKTKLFETVYDPYDQTVLDPHNGHRVDVNQAVKRSLLGHNTCLVYDTDKSRQVSYRQRYCVTTDMGSLVCIKCKFVFVLFLLSLERKIYN